MEEKFVVCRFLTLTAFSDGSFSRAPYDPPPLPASPAFSDGVQVATQDVLLNHTLGTSARLFLPAPASSSSKLPLLLYFHGGAFIYGSTALPDNNNFLSRLATHAQTLIISVEYRLAPEHRLPAAYDDSFHALLWLHRQAEYLQSGSASPACADLDNQLQPWLAAHADFSKLFLGGDSAGANIAHNVALRAAGRSWEHLRLQGMIMIHSFFGSEARSDSELRNSDKLELVKQLAKLFLPEGANQDHPFMNPTAPNAPSLADLAAPRVLVAVASEDWLAERSRAYYEALVRAGKQANLFISENEDHVFHLRTPESKNVETFIKVLSQFLNSSV